jgi:hypothetical protein
MPAIVQACREGFAPLAHVLSEEVLTVRLASEVDLLQERRERCGFSNLTLSAEVHAVAPIVARLTGT